MDWLTEVIPFLVLGILQMLLAFAIGSHMLRNRRGKGDHR